MNPAELSRQVKHLEITTRRLVTEVFAGEYSSAFRGRGIEFADVREYQPGDDIRSIDWNVTARTGRPFVKRFSEERELTIMLCVDFSASGDFSTQPRTKRELAAEIAGVLSFAAIKKNDRVGLTVFTDRIELAVPPAKGSRHVLRLIRELLAVEPEGRGTNFDVVAEHLGRTLRRTAVVFLISDFLDAPAADACRRLGVRHDLTAIQIVDPRERELPDVGLVRTIDPESGATRVLDTSSRRVRDAFRAAYERRQEEVEAAFRDHRTDLVRLSTDRPYIHDLIELFRVREHRR